jgi:hypothetical protein
MASAARVKGRRVAIEGMIEVAVPRKEQIDLPWIADRLGDPADGGRVREEAAPGERESATPSIEGILRDAGDVAIGQDLQVADLVEDVGDRHPGDVDVCRCRRGAAGQRR